MCHSCSLPGAILDDRADDLRDDVAGPLHDDVVAGADVLAVDVVLVVQRGPLHGDAADEDRLEHGERREDAGAAHVDLDGAQPRRGRGGGELVGDRPARVVGHRAERLLQLERVDLDDHAVDVEVEVGAARLPLRAARRDLFDGRVTLHVRMHAEALRAQPLQGFPVTGDGAAVVVRRWARRRPRPPCRSRSTRRSAAATRPRPGRAGGCCRRPSCAGSRTSAGRPGRAAR